MPERVTFDLGPDGPDPRAQAAIDAAFWEDGHVLLLGPAGGPQQALHLVPAGPGALAAYEMQQPRPAGPAAAKQQRPSSASRRRPGSAGVAR